MVHQTDMLAPNDARAFYNSDEYGPVLEATVAENREKLDSGLGDQLFAKYRANENEYGGKYRLILVGALMRRAGAKIKNEDLQHLRDLVPQINCNEGYASPLMDEGFRGPGKRQFLAALDNYTPGMPRSFGEPSCFSCGKIGADIQKHLDKCSRCKEAWYCNHVSWPARYLLERPTLTLRPHKPARRLTGRRISHTALRPSAGLCSTFSGGEGLGLHVC